MVLIGALIASGGALLSSSQQAQFEHELRAKTEEIAELNRTIAASVTGGDSYCYLVIGIVDHGKNAAFAWVSHRGEYPLYDVNLTVVKSNDMQRIERASFEELSHIRTEFDVGNMTQGETRLWRKWLLPDEEPQSYHVFIRARNGVFRQQIRLKKVEGHWKKATKVTRHGEGEQQGSSLYERVDNGFPLNEQDQVDWD